MINGVFLVLMIGVLIGGVVVMAFGALKISSALSDQKANTPNPMLEDTPHTFTEMPIAGLANHNVLLESMHGKVVSVGYNRDVTTDTTNYALGASYSNRNRDREDAECFVVDDHGGIHTLMICLRDSIIHGALLEDHAEALAQDLGVEFVRF